MTVTVNIMLTHNDFPLLPSRKVSPRPFNILFCETRVVIAHRIFPLFYFSQGFNKLLVANDGMINPKLFIFITEVIAKIQKA